AFNYKPNAQLLSIFIIAGGALTSFMQIWTPAFWVVVVSGGLGGLIAIAEGWQRIARYRETWIAYRTASEQRRLFVNAAGRYRGLAMRIPLLGSWKLSFGKTNITAPRNAPTIKGPNAFRPAR